MSIKKQKSPAFQWYPKDYMTDTRVLLLTLEEEGAYRKLLDICWLEKNRVSSNPNDICKLISKECTIEIATKIKMFFTEMEGGKMMSERMELEIKKQKKFNTKQKANGSKGGRPQKEKPNDNPEITHGFPESEENETQTKALHLHSSIAFANNNTISLLAQEIFEKIKTSKQPFSDVVLHTNQQHYQDIEKMVPAEEWPKLVEKWNNKILESRWKWSEDFTADTKSLYASLKNYTISWSENLAKKKSQPPRKATENKPDPEMITERVVVPKDLTVKIS